MRVLVGEQRLEVGDGGLDLAGFGAVGGSPGDVVARPERVGMGSGRARGSGRRAGVGVVLEGGDGGLDSVSPAWARQTAILFRAMNVLR
jgi:hypothetical protein